LERGRRARSRVAANTRAYSELWQGASIDRCALPFTRQAPTNSGQWQSSWPRPPGILLAKDGSETIFKRGAPDYRVVYFATHGLVAGERLAEPSLPLTLPQANSATSLDRERSDAACRLGGALGLSDFVGQSAPQQKDHNDDYQYRAESPAIIMVRSAQIETTAAEKENQNNQE
jgi:hypothetical protein